MDRGSPREAVLMAAAAAEPVSLRDLSSGLDLSAEELRGAVAEAIATGELLALDGGPPADATLLYTAEGFAALSGRLRDVLVGYHRQFPLRRGIPKEELRTRLGLESRAFDQAVALWTSRGEVREAAGSVARPEHEPRPDAAQEEEAKRLLEALRSQPLSPPSLDTDDDLLTYLEDNGDIVWVSAGIVFAAEAYREMVERVVAHLNERRTVTLAQVRDLLGTSRKYAQALLEHMDEQRITRRVGDERVLR